MARHRPKYTAIAEPLRKQYGDRLVDEALDRLEHGDVAPTQYGTRVALRPNLGDDRSYSRSGAYWPRRKSDEGPLRCMCHEFKTTRRCSHVLAALIFEWQ